MASFDFTGFARYVEFSSSGTLSRFGTPAETGSGTLAEVTASTTNGVLTIGESVSLTLPDGTSVGNMRHNGVLTLTEATTGEGAVPRTAQFIVLRSALAIGSARDYYLIPIVPVPAGFAFPASIPRTDVSSVSFTLCFLAGTRIATPGGEVAVENLCPGDLVLTADGRALPVLRLGRQEVATAFVGHDAALPVEIAPGALAEGVPSRALRVTPDHALLIDGVLVQAGALVNGTTIRRMTARELPAVFPVFHVETAEHVALLAEGAAAESYVANVPDARMGWQGDAPAVPVDEMDAPRAMSARQVPREILDAIAARVPARAA